MKSYALCARVASLALLLLSSNIYATECTSTIGATDSTTKKTAMVAGTVVGIAAAQLNSKDPRITFVAGEIGCEYGEEFANAWRTNKAALALFGSLYVFAEMPVSKETGQYFIQYMGDVPDKALDQSKKIADDTLKASDVLLTPTLVTAGEAAKIAEKNGIDGKTVATAILLINPTQALIEVATGKEAKKIADQAARDAKNGVNKFLPKKMSIK
jgi:hypothetical protein